MLDNYGRQITYLRLSVTDLCNLRCLYCMPAHGIEKLPHSAILTLEEIEEIVGAAVRCGIRKIRLTGGEPLVRRGIIDICRRISAIDGVEELCMTTNAVLLPRYARDLREAGVSRLNISLDTLRPERFAQISRIGTFADVQAGLAAARETGFDRIKINCVLMGGVNDDEIRDFVELTRNEKIGVRFIELMPIGECADWDRERFLPGSVVLERVPELKPWGDDGVSVLYKLEGGLGTVGLITPVSSHFCPTCNRIRVTSDGKLKPCLHSAGEINLKGLHGEELYQTMRKAIAEKPRRHHIAEDGKSASLRNMNAIGG